MRFFAETFKSMCLSGVQPSYVADSFARPGQSSFVLVAYATLPGRSLGRARPVAFAKCTCMVEPGLTGAQERVVFVDLVCSDVRGLGKVLVDEADSVGRDLGATLMVLSSVPTQWKTYAKWGFVRGTGLAVDKTASQAVKTILKIGSLNRVDGKTSKVLDSKGLFGKDIDRVRDYINVLKEAGPLGYHGKFNHDGLVAMYRRILGPGGPGGRRSTVIWDSPDGPVYTNPKLVHAHAVFTSSGGRWVRDSGTATAGTDKALKRKGTGMGLFGRSPKRAASPAL